MNKMTKKKDFKLLMGFFAIETIILIVCIIVAHFKVNSAEVYAASDAEGFAESSASVRTNILQKSFGGSGVQAFSILSGDSSEAITLPESGSLLYKYYTFNLSDSGVTSNLTKAKQGTQLSGIVSNTATSTVIAPARSTLKLGNLTINNNYVYESLDLVSILDKPLVIEPMDKSSILLYHVHAEEGYCKTENDKYNLNSAGVKGEEGNVVYMGNLIQDLIKSKTGISIIHDKTVFKQGLDSIIGYNNAAVRLNEIYAENENIKLQVDIHCDSVIYEGAKYGPTVEYGGVKYAPLSFVIGLDWDASTGDRSASVNPYWEDNFKLCLLVIEKLEQKVPGIVRHIELRRTPYNQNFAENSLLVEIGFDGNLVSEAEASAKIFGEVLSDIYG